MLQQTQARRVAELLPHFLHTFPTLEDLADATASQVIQAWRGLGYNNRAVRLRDTARIIVDDHGGIIPDNPSTLKNLPGIGEYASNSLPCFIYGKRTVVVDVNVRRVYSRWMQRQADTSTLSNNQQIREFANHIIPKQNVSDWHHAVMDLGATICKARTALCTECPIRKICPSEGLPQAPYQQTMRSEPMLRGKPRRLWRGWIVEQLRNCGDKGLGIRELLPDRVAYTSELPEWTLLLNALEADGIISIDRRIRLRN